MLTSVPSSGERYAYPPRLRGKSATGWPSFKKPSIAPIASDVQPFRKRTGRYIIPVDCSWNSINSRTSSMPRGGSAAFAP